MNVLSNARRDGLLAESDLADPDSSKWIINGLDANFRVNEECSFCVYSQLLRVQPCSPSPLLPPRVARWGAGVRGGSSLALLAAVACVLAVLRFWLSSSVGLQVVPSGWALVCWCACVWVGPSFRPVKPRPGPKKLKA